jgi:peptidyl-prolyl cis-trans isomerase SurA
MIRSVPLAAVLAAALALAPMPALPQEGLFSPIMVVNERPITRFELEQRILMLQLFRAPGDIEEAALTGLVEDRLRLFAAAQLDLEITPEQLRAGMEEFASRANLSADEFLAALAQGGVEAETFRDFVEAGVLWREVVRARFLPRVRISDAEVDRAIEAQAQAANVEVLLSELVIAAPPGGEGSALALARRLRTEIASEGAFARAARAYSSAPSAAGGGRLDWVPLANLPAQLAPLVLSLRPGQVTEPVRLPGAVTLFQLRAIREVEGEPAGGRFVDYARISLVDAADPVAERARLDSLSDTCNDLYGVMERLPADRLVRQTVAAAALPEAVARELDRLDPGEIGPVSRAGGAPVALMLCSRNAAPPENAEAAAAVPGSLEGLVTGRPDRDQIRDQIRNRRVSALADGYLEELRADAIIRDLRPGAADGG